MARKVIYRFASGNADGNTNQKALLGGKGANLAEMAGLGIPVPPGFTITTEMCTEYMDKGGMPDGLIDEVKQAMAWLEKTTGKKFGDANNPLLVSVRSGARASMPGMMDTVLNLGLNDTSVQGMAKLTGNERFVYDAYRRLLTMYGDVVLGVDKEHFEDAMNVVKRQMAKEKGIAVPEDDEELGRVIPDSKLEAAQWKVISEEFKKILAAKTASGFPMDPVDQLVGAIKAVFDSWNNKRAQTYRKMHNIPASWGTAVNVQSMVFGNMGDTSATGVAFTRDPSTGEKKFFGEWLPNAQGEDVVAGIRTPQPIKKGTGSAGKSLEEAMPDNYKELDAIQKKLENHYKDMQDLEFTIEQGKLFMLQTRNGKRTAPASVKIAIDMCKEGLISEEDAVMRVEPDRINELLFPMIDPKASNQAVAKGINASPGAVTGKAVFSADDAVAVAEKGDKPILVRIETSPEDIHGMKAAVGILTARGGATSHAAVVARGMGKSCVAGCAGISIDYGPEKAVKENNDYSQAKFTAAGQTVKVGDLITIDGTGGRVYVGDVPKIPPKIGGEFEQLLTFADKYARMKVRANAETPEAAKAREMGAQGIGLCRTEHMFFTPEGILAIREMIVANDLEAREKALAKVLPIQAADFAQLFEIMDGFPVNIRLLDPPLHEFLPHEPDQQAEVAKSVGVTPEAIKAKVADLHEFNPMLGHRGVRLAVAYPEIAATQVKAILTAACQVQKKGKKVAPEIMIPLSLSKKELDLMKEVVDRVSKEVFAAEKTEVKFKFGTMIELPRAALLAHELAEVAEFFSFGTNDLTQTTMGLSRDDAGKFLPPYVDQGVFEKDPFVSLDVAGVGELVQIAADRGRKTRPNISLGICGEHGGDPASIEFCDKVGLGYVSCSPFRVPVARVAAAQAAIVAKKGDAEKTRTV
jgi:pyruvate,orthophosphate dikinase